MKTKSTFAKLTLLALLAGAMTYYAASLNRAAAAIQGKGAPNSVTSSSTFSNPAAITINDSASPPTTATPYSSNIAVSGAGPITKLTVTLTNVSHAFPDDIDVLLVGPTGQSAILMSDSGGGGSISNVTLTFDDAAASSLPDPPQIVTGAYVPTNYGGGDTFPGPAPAPPYGATLSVFNGTASTGTWKLFVVDDANGQNGSISGGWSLTILTKEFVVSNTNNSGAGSLRQAILDANANSNSQDTISFNIPGAGVHTISPTSALPAITEFVFIDGTTQPGYAGVPLIELNGASAGTGASGLKITSSGFSFVKGLIINRFTNHGIEIPSGNSVFIQGNYIGTNAAGTAALGNSGDGVNFQAVTNCKIGGTTAAERNLISGNGGNGIALGASCAGVHIEGNYIGTDLAGNVDLGNAGAGVLLSNAPTNTIGGTSAGEGNIISGNNGDGIQINSALATGNIVQGNYIGTNATGTAALGNTRDGVLILTNANNSKIGGTSIAARNVISGNIAAGIGISNSTGCTVQGNIVGLNATGTISLANGLEGVAVQATANNNTIGGTTQTPGAPPGNILSGNSRYGIRVGVFSPNNTVAGNIVGLDVTGTLVRGNGFSGVRVESPNNVIGGASASARNIVSGNVSHGISIDGSVDPATGNLLQNNFVGTDITGSIGLGNGDAGVVVFTASSTTIGGGVGLGNIIAFNAGLGVVANIGTGNTIFANSIHSNGGLGIDLGFNGVTPNDPLDADSGTNNLQNYPVIGTAANTGTGTFVAGSLNSAPNQTFTIEFFSNTVFDPPGYGEGRAFLGAINATTAADGNVIFNVTLPLTVPAGQYITTTATDASGNTSEFSFCRQVTTASPTAVEFAAASATGFDDGVLIQWQTGMEVDNVGFNLYRDESGKRSLVNQQIIAGSAFVVGEGVAVRSGFSYEWWDARPASKAAQYWLESLDLNGSSAWYGPFAATSSQGKDRPARVDQAKTLASLGGNESPSLQLEPLAKPSSASQSSKSFSQASSLVAASNGVKIAVKQAGFYRVTQPELVAAGLDPACDPRSLQLFVDGREQAISVAGEADGRFDPKDAVEFYGVGIDSPFTASHNYFLISAKQQGRRIETLPSFAKPNPGGGFAFTTERRDKTIYFAALLNGDAENFFGSVLATQPLNQTLTVQHPDLTATENATLEVALQGVTNFTHSVAVQLNGSTVGYAAFNKLDHFVIQLPVSASLLREGVNTVTLRTTGNGADVSLVDYLRLTYQHTLTADGDSLRFTALAQQQVTIDGFTDKAIRVFDVTSPDSVQELEGTIDEVSNGFTVSLQVQGSGERTLVAMTDSATKKPTRVSLDSPSALRSSRNAAEFVIITHHDLVNEAQILKATRQAQGLSVAVVDIEDIFDEFSYGQKTPNAVKDFLAYAKKSWRGPLRYVLLFGDASYDSKNYLGAGEFDLVPTKLIDTAFIEGASDDWLADFNRDGLAELAIGRVPVRNQTEAALMIKKLIGYDQSKPSEEVLGVADRNEGYDFEHAIDQLKDLVPANLKTVQVKRGQLGDAAARTALLDAINRGQKLVSYSGHGSANVWRGNLLTSPDAGPLQNKERLSVFLMMNCLNGYFADPTMESLSEALLKAEGGAVAVWASSALTYPDSQTAMSQELYRQLFSNPGTRIGDAIVKAKATASDMDVRQTWILFGDPTMRLR